MRAVLSIGAMLSVAIAAPVVAAQAAAVRDAGAPGNKLICHSEARTGTRFTKKICHSRAEWDQMEEAARRGASELIDAPKINNTNEH